MQVHPALKCFSGSKLRSSRLPVAGKKVAQCSNDLISLPMDKANRNRRSIRSPKPAPPQVSKFNDQTLVYSTFGFIDYRRVMTQAILQPR